MNDAPDVPLFQKLKAICVPLLGASLSELSPASILTVSRLLSNLISQLQAAHNAGAYLETSIINYTFVPLSTILRRNPPSNIPDRILEKIFTAIEILGKDWWWTCGLDVWEQLFILCGSILGGMESNGKSKARDDETKEAAVRCLCSLLRPRSDLEGIGHSALPSQRLEELRTCTKSPTFIPVLGQTLDSLLILATSQSPSLQRGSLDLLNILLDIYFPDQLIPTVLPGVASTMTKLALGTTSHKTWANGDIVSKSMSVLDAVIVKALGDDVCARDGAIVIVQELEDLTYLSQTPRDSDSSAKFHPFSTKRTPSWLRGTSSQLHIALNSLTPLVRHPSPIALTAMAKLSSSIILATPNTLPQSHPLLLSFILSVSLSEYPTVSTHARNTLLAILRTPKAQESALENLMGLTRDSLMSLPRLIASQSDTKIQHTAGVIEAISNLSTGKIADGIPAISHEVGKLLGPTGGIEKWGWGLLSVLELTEPSITLAHSHSTRFSLEDDPSTSQLINFPEILLKNIHTREANNALKRMLVSIGTAAGESCLPTIEWFISVGQKDTTPMSNAALWCAARLFEGISTVSLSDVSKQVPMMPASKRLEKFIRNLVKTVSLLWDEETDGTTEKNSSTIPPTPDSESSVQVLQGRGLNPVDDTLKIIQPSSASQPRRVISQPLLHSALALHIIAVSSTVLQARFNTLLFYALYPILHSIVSSDSFLSATGLATLSYITFNVSYASPASLLLSNFDYALDSISRRLSRRWLDIEATKVLITMIRIIGSDVVERAGDIVEECFDRLDEYHGYSVVVEGLVAVLNEVVTVIKTDDEGVKGNRQETKPKTMLHEDQKMFSTFLEDYSKPNPTASDENQEYERAPHVPWDTLKDEEPAKTDEDEVGNDNNKPLSAPQELTKQIVSRSMYFLTHGSPVIRARILNLLTSSVHVLTESSLLPSIHQVWPFITNRLSDKEFFVVTAAATLVESLSDRMGTFMFRRIWDDIWPQFRKLLEKLNAADGASALARRGPGFVGTETAYSHSHRVYRAILRTMTATINGVDPQDVSIWQVIIACRRFLHSHAHEELQQCAQDLFFAIGLRNADAVWLALFSTFDKSETVMHFLNEPKWDLKDGADVVLGRLAEV